MDWLQNIVCNPGAIAHLVAIYAVVICIGVRLGKIKFGGVSLGVTFVLFMGILVGHIYSHYIIDPATNETINHAGQNIIIDFVKEFGLILFVYCIGLQVGPGFFATFKRGGVKMNLVAVSIVLLNVLVMLGLYFMVFEHNNYNLAMMVGTLYGAVTNTPGLGAANAVVKEFTGTWGSTDISQVPDMASSYACAYPLGVVGIILATILIRYICNIKLEAEQEQIRKEQESDPHATPKHIIIRVTNKAVIGRALAEVRRFLNRDFVVSRCIKNNDIIVPNDKTVLEENMEVHVVCAEDEAEPIAALIGELSNETWTPDVKSAKYVSRRLVITKPEINGKTFGQLHFNSIYGVNVTRVTRNGLELFANRNLRLQIGDRLLVTGREEDVEHVKNAIGDSVKRLDHPNVGAIFFGILLGVILGQINFGAGMKLGLAGGPLVVAILIGAFGYRIGINSYTSTSANLMLREVGLLLFLSSVGIQAGAKFWDTILAGGITYVWTGFLITTIPILVMGIIARKFLKLNYFTLMGLIAGSNTDPPALAFANQTANNDAPAVGYSTVYPLTMFLRIIIAQVILMIFLS